MKIGETIASRRRVGPLQAVDSSGDAVTGATFAGAGELELMPAGEAFGAAAGTIGEIGSSWYYYEAALEDAVGPWFAVKLAGVCEEFAYQEDVAEIQEGIVAGETDVEALTIGPIPIVDEDGEPLASIVGIDVDLSLTGSPWDAPGGTLQLGDDGFAYYVAAPSEAVQPGWIALRLTGACEEVVFVQEVVVPVVVVSPGPELPDPPTAISVVHSSPTYHLVVAAALDRLPQQYRGDDDVPTELLP